MCISFFFVLFFSKRKRKKSCSKLKEILSAMKLYTQVNIYGNHYVVVYFALADFFSFSILQIS